MRSPGGDDPPVGSPMSLGTRPSTAEPIDVDEVVPIPGLLGRLLSAVGLGGAATRRTDAGDQPPAHAPTTSSSDSEPAPGPRPSLPVGQLSSSPPRSTRSSRRALAKGADADAATTTSTSTATEAAEEERVLDRAMTGLHIDPAAKPGAAFAPPSTATPPLPPKPLPTAVPPPATAPPALAAAVPRRVTRAAAASGASSASGGGGSGGSSAGSEAEEVRRREPAQPAAAVKVEAAAPPPPPTAEAAAPPPAHPAAAAAAAAAVKPAGKTRAAAAAAASTPTLAASAALIPRPRAAPATHLVAAGPASPSPSDLLIGLVTDPAMEAHIPPTSHVERPARLSVLAGLLARNGLKDRCAALVPRAATDEELLRMHSRDHIESVDCGYEAALADGALEQGDMYYSPGTATAARLAAGCVTQAVLAVLSGEVRRAFAAVRPPGHHATCARAMGFCFFNNVTVAAAAALQAGARRVLIVDWDVHHGNGCQDLVHDANAKAAAAGKPPSLAYVSLHRSAGFYPGTGHAVETGPPGAKGTLLNVAWPRGGVTDADCAAAFDLVVMPWAAAFDPDLVIIAAGMDAAAGDPLGGCDVSPAGFAHMARRLCSLAGGKVVAALEGGYNTAATAASAAAVVEAMLRAGTADDPEADRGAGAAPPGRPSKDAASAIEAAVTAHAQYVPALRPLAGSAAFNRAWQDYSLATQAARVLRPRGGGTGGSGTATPVAPAGKG